MERDRWAMDVHQFGRLDIHMMCMDLMSEFGPLDMHMMHNDAMITAVIIGSSLIHSLSPSLPASLSPSLSTLSLPRDPFLPPSFLPSFLSSRIPLSLCPSLPHPSLPPSFPSFPPCLTLKAAS